MPAHRQLSRRQMSRPLSDNPYQTPQTEGRAPHRIERTRSAEILIAYFRWLVICGISAAPSFVIAFDGLRVVSITAMLSGIMTFVIGYTLVECHPAIQRKLASDSALRRAVLIGYGTRIGISIIFPVGIVLDFFVGILATGITGWQPDRTIALGEMESASFDFFIFYVTTIVQGLLLNVVLFGYLLIVYAIIGAIRTVRKSHRTEN